MNNQTYPLPITLLEIGKALELSESTISRVVQSKYIQLPDKLISLNSLLERRVNTKSDGRDISPRELERLLVKLTSEEDKEVPYTDENLRYILKESYSVDIARRTISKYREGINIPIARFRKKQSFNKISFVKYDPGFVYILRLESILVLWTSTPRTILQN